MIVDRRSSIGHRQVARSMIDEPSTVDDGRWTIDDDALRPHRR
jgi:hypothetical protein